MPAPKETKAPTHRRAPGDTGTTLDEDHEAKRLDEDHEAKRLDGIIAEAEQRVAEQAMIYEMMDFDGQDTGEAMRALRASEDILVEFIRARTGLRARRAKAGRHGT